MKDFFVDKYMEKGKGGEKKLDFFHPHRLFMQLY